MKKIDPAQAVGILANLGVLIGILLLVYELNQNRTMMQAQTRATVTDGFTNHMYQVTKDSEISDIMVRGNRGEELTSIEQSRYALLNVALIRYYENVHYQYRQGLYSEEEFRGQREAWRRASFSNVGLKDQFCGGRPLWSPDFVKEVESLLSEPCE